MDFDNNSISIINAYINDPTNTRNSYNLGSLFWNTITKQIGTIIRENKNIENFINKEKNFINFGLDEHLLDNVTEINKSILNDDLNYNHIKIELLSDWLSNTLAEIMEGNRKDLLLREIKNAKLQIKHLEDDLTALTDTRKEILLSLLSDSNKPSPQLIRRIDQLSKVDEMKRNSLKRKREVANGVFFSVEERRSFVKQENELQNGLRNYEALLSQIKTQTEKATLRSHEAKLEKLINKILISNENIEKMEKEIKEIEIKQESISPVEIENLALRSIEYIRDLTKLCAKRLRNESCSFLRPSDKFFTINELKSCFDRILEFDPKIFNNERVSFLGKPSILLVPGNGKAIYDWKYNRFIVPLSPPGGEFMGSISASIIEYRFDVDDDKTLLNSYWKLPDNKKTKSMFQIKAKLTKDYITWMSSEYKGFRVLPKDTKKWFEREIAPSINDIYCPPEYQSFSISAKEFNKKYKQIEEITKNANLLECSNDDLWAGSILTAQQGEFERAFEYLNALKEKKCDYKFLYYNLGYIGMKVSRKQEAINGFNEFAKQNPQSWWATVARNHVRHLQMS